MDKTSAILLGAVLTVVFTHWPVAIPIWVAIVAFALYASDDDGARNRR